MESTKRVSEQSSQKSGQGNAQTKAADLKAQISDTGNEILEQAKQTATDVYQRASKSLNETYNQAVDYGRDHPGTTTLIALGAGIGIGILLSSSIMGLPRN